MSIVPPFTPVYIMGRRAFVILLSVAIVIIAVIYYHLPDDNVDFRIKFIISPLRMYIATPSLSALLHHSHSL